jgi:type II secretory pathway pseudopilin PulG
LAVVTILAIVAMIVIPRLGPNSASAKEKGCFHNKSEINAAVERYYFDNGALPANTAALSAYFPDGVPACPVTGAVYTLDAVSSRVTGHTTGSH